MPGNEKRTDNTVIVSLGKFLEVTTRKLWQYDYGMRLVFTDVDLPDAYAVHFSNKEFDGDAIVQVGNSDGVVIPDELFLTGKDIHAWIYLHSGDDDGETVYNINIPVRKRSQPIDVPPNPIEQGMIDRAISILNDAISETHAATEDAQGHAYDSEAWAVGKRGGEDVGSHDETFHNNSAYYAYIASQAAGNAGYMDFFINEEGDLIYSRTDGVNVDFEIRDGYLYMGVITDA